MLKTIVIGKGSIGKELQKQINFLGWSIESIFTSKNILNSQGKEIALISQWKNYIKADVVFMTTPTSCGSISYEYLKYCLEQNIPVVTCEKGTLSEYFENLSSFVSKIGYSATVGGGTRMLKYLEVRNKEKITNITGVVNGTLNFIFSKLSDGVTQEKVIEEILEKKYSEPGTKTFSEIINAELSDLYRKAIITANVSGLLKNKIIFKNTKKIEDKIIDLAIKNPKDYRFLFLMSKDRNTDFVDGFSLEIDEWFVYAGLFKTINFQIVFSEGVNNCLYLKEGESLYCVSGPGAGPEPTALAMIADAKELLRL